MKKDNPLRWFLDLREGESDAVLWSFGFHFCILAAYYILQPLRDNLAHVVGEEHIPSLFRWSLVAMLVANPVFSLLLGRIPRTRLLPIVFRFFTANILLFVLGFKFLPESHHPSLGWVYFLWVGVFNLFSIALFWCLMADGFTSDQGKRLFGFIGAGGTLGMFAGSLIAGRLVHLIGADDLLIVSAVILELGVWCMFRLAAVHETSVNSPRVPTDPADVVGSGRGLNEALAGIRAAVRSPYMMMICVNLFLYSFSSSFLYFEKQSAVTTMNETDRVAFFSNINLAVSVGTFVVQFFFTGAIIQRFGVAATLLALPLFSALGFVYIGFTPLLVPIALFELLRKTLNYAIARPSREVLFTVVSRQEKYSAKNFIDTFVYRGGDAVASVAFEQITSHGAGLSGVAFSAVPFCGLWLVNSAWLGHRQVLMAEKQQQDGPSASGGSGSGCAPLKSATAAI